MKKHWILVLLLFLLGATAVYALNQKAKAREAALEIVNIAARADTARLLVVDSVSTAYELLIVQKDLEKDSISVLLDTRPVVRIQGRLRVDTLNIVDTVAAPIPEDTVEVYAFGGEDGPFRFVGDARLFPNRTQIFTVAVSSSPVGTLAIISCGDEQPIRSAHLVLKADDPFEIIPTGVEQTPDVCNAPRAPVFSITKGRAVWAGAGFLVGMVVANLVDDGFRVANY